MLQKSKKLHIFCQTVFVDDIKGVQKVLGNLAVDGDIGANTAEAIASYAKANNLTLEQASDRLVELGRKYNEIEEFELSGEEIKQIQKKLNNLGITDIDGDALAVEPYLGECTVSAINKYANTKNISLKDAVDKLLNRDAEWQKAIQDSKNNNVRIKEKENTLQFRESPNLTAIEAHPQTKVTDEEVLNEFDLMKVNALKGLYNWAIEKGDRLTADKAHKAAVDIRSNPKYDGTGYGSIYMDTYDYSDEYERDKDEYPLTVVRAPIDILYEFLYHHSINNISLSDSGALDIITPYFDDLLSNKLETKKGVVGTFINLLVALAERFDDYAPGAKVGDIPILMGDEKFLYRPSDGSVIIVN